MHFCSDGTKKSALRLIPFPVLLLKEGFFFLNIMVASTFVFIAQAGTITVGGGS